MDLTILGTSLFWTYKHNKEMPIIINKKYWPLGLTPTTRTMEKLWASMIRWTWWRSYRFELDSQVVVQAVLSSDLIRKPWGFIVRRCKRFLQSHPNSSICWVHRSRNRVAHQLTRWAESEPNKEWINTFPICINSYIQKDISALYSPD
jgi:hypothetical protein